MRFKHLVTIVASTALVLSAPAYAAAAAPDTLPAKGGSSSPQAEAALAKVQDLFRGGQKARARAYDAQPVAATERPDATMALRDLALELDNLSDADRAAAERYFQRPTDPGTTEPAEYTVAEGPAKCSPRICVHHVPSTPDAPPPAMGAGDPLVNDQVELTLATAEAVYNRIVTTGGYRAPLSDGTKGGGPEIDIYLANLGDDGLYGYCTLDEPITAFEMPAYCVVDDDFVEFPGGALASLQVTVAHEFFHAVQFAYEWTEDLWLMEGTAVWMEDEVYDSINDNMNFIRPGSRGNPISRPDIPLDRFDNSWPSYGGFVFWKKLTETYPAKAGTSLPNIVREVWTAAATHSARGASTMALSKVLARHHTSFGAFFTKWGVGNRFPARSYSEGRANGYPTAPLSGRYALSKSKRNLAWKGIKLDHMTNAHARITPKLLRGRGWKLRVTVDAPDRIRGSYATVVVHKKSGAISKAKVRLNRSGAGVKTVPFGVGTVKYVEVTLTNASNRFKGCYPSSGYSSITCGGRSLDNNLPFRFKASVLR